MIYARLGDTTKKPLYDIDWCAFATSVEASLFYGCGNVINCTRFGTYYDEPEVRLRSAFSKEISQRFRFLLDGKELDVVALFRNVSKC